MRPIQGDLAAGVARTTDGGGLAPALLDAIESAGGMWHAGDYYATPATIVSSARDKGVRALRVDARDLAFLRELPELEFLHIRSDGRPPLEPVVALPNLRALVIETGALRGKLDLSAHPGLEWLKVKVSGRGGTENLPVVLAGHPNVRDLRLSEVPFKDLTQLAAGFPAARYVRIFGGNRLRAVGDVSPWNDGLRGFGTVWAPLRTVEELASMRALQYLSLSFARLAMTSTLRSMEGLRYLSLLGDIPSIKDLAGHPGLRIARLWKPADDDLDPLQTMPALAAVIGRPKDGRRTELPFLEELPPDHALRREWRNETQSSEHPAML
jgi:hypothetical protein